MAIIWTVEDEETISILIQRVIQSMDTACTAAANWSGR